MGAAAAVEFEIVSACHYFHATIPRKSSQICAPPNRLKARGLWRARDRKTREFKTWERPDHSARVSPRTDTPTRRRELPMTDAGLG